MEYYYLGMVEIPSVLTKMEKALSDHLRQFEYSVFAEDELDNIILNLKDKQRDILSENSRLKKVDINWAKVKYISSNMGGHINIGRNSIGLIKINKFYGL